MARDGGADRGGLPGGPRAMKVSAIVIVTGTEETALMRRSLPSLRPQVDELIVVANGPGSVDGDVPDDVRVLRNDRMLGFSANINAGTVATCGEYVVVSNPDAIPEPGAGAPLVAFGG